MENTGLLLNQGGGQNKMVMCWREILICSFSFCLCFICKSDMVLCGVVEGDFHYLHSLWIREKSCGYAVFVWRMQLRAFCYRCVVVDVMRT